MHKFLVIKSINPGFTSTNTTTSDNSKNEDEKNPLSSSSTVDNTKNDKKDLDEKDNSIKSSPSLDNNSDKENNPPKPTPSKKKQGSTKKLESTTPKKSSSITKDNNDDQSKKSTLSTDKTNDNQTTDKPMGLQQTLVSAFFQLPEDGKPVWKYLFEKEAADRLERERLEKERLEKEKALELANRKELQKKKAEAKKKRVAERKKREEQEWEEYLMMKEKTTKGVEIIPSLYLGSYFTAKNDEWLLEASIKKIVNVTSEVPCYFKTDDVVKEENDIDDGDEEEDDDEDDPSIEDPGNENVDEGEENMNVDESPADSGDNKQPQEEETEKSTQKPEEMSTDEKSTDSNPKELETPLDKLDEKNNTSPTENKDVVMDVADNSNENNIVTKPNSEPSYPNHDKILNIQYFRIPIADSGRAKIETYFEEACKFIGAKDENGNVSNVLVHCKQGRSRSPSIIIAYLMKEHQWTLEKAFNHLATKSIKGLTVNDGFKQKLMDYEFSLFNQNSINFFDAKSRSRTRSSNKILSDAPSHRVALRIQHGPNYDDIFDDDGDEDENVDKMEEDNSTKSTKPPKSKSNSRLKSNNTKEQVPDLKADTKTIISEETIRSLLTNEDENASKCDDDTIDDLKVTKRRKTNNSKMVIEEDD
eukprot:gene2925-3644_t